jgi:hypothetical protein
VTSSATNLFTLERRPNLANEARKRAAAGKKARILGVCRALMATGCFRPNTLDIAAGAEAKPHDVINNFDSLAALYDEALDNDTVRAIARQIMRRDCEDLLLLDDMRGLARAAVFGKVDQ